MKRLSAIAFGLTIIGALGFGATEAYAARSVLLGSGCGDWNWCAPSEGGDENCNTCCGPSGGFCTDYREAPEQYCLCFG
jgi:hypothetical protein